MPPFSLKKLTWLSYGVALAAIVLDQLTKWIVLHVLNMQLGQTIEISPIFDLTLP